MTFKVNYGFQKAERDRAKLAKKEAKRREKEAATAQQPTRRCPEKRIRPERGSREPVTALIAAMRR